MIPTYNCAGYLEETLASVLAEVPDPADAQIEVVDDDSRDRPEDVVERLGRGRVAFHRHGENIGAIGNFNSCLARSRGYLVHVLHGDDRVAPGFYAEIARLAEAAPDAALLATRCVLIDDQGLPLGVTPRLPALEQPARDASPLWYGCPLQFPGVVIRRRFYEKAGGFDERFVHVADWEMWLRATLDGGAVVSPRAFACYRVSEGNDTSRLVRTGENLRDYLRLLEVMAPRLPALDRMRFRRLVAAGARYQAQSARSRGDRDAAQANEALWRELASVGLIFRPAARAVLNALTDIRRLFLR